MTKPRISMPFPQIAERVFNTPLLIEEGKLHAILSVLAPRMGFDTGFEVDPQAMIYTDMDPHMELIAQLESQGMSTKYVEDGGYYLVDGKVALVPVLGSLVHRSSFMDEMSGMTSYAKAQRRFDAAMNDNKVHTIVMEYDTPGGEVSGAFDFADHMYAARGEKPVIAVASEKATSAGYLLASAADEVVLPRTGRMGSIGVVSSHMDMSRALEKKGVAVTLLYAGEKKVDGNPYQPLDERVTAEWMSELADTYRLFTSTVARNMSISEESVIATQAGVYTGGKAVSAGLAHRVNTLSNELANASLRAAKPRLAARIQSSATSPEQENHMQGNQQQGGQGTVSAEEATRREQAAHASGITEGQRGMQEAVDRARNEGMTTERTRVQGILAHAEAAGRASMASHLAFNTNMTVEDAGKMLAAAPKETAASDSKSPLERAMQEKSPGIRAQEPQPQPGAAASINTNDIYSQRAQAAASYRS